MNQQRAGMPAADPRAALLDLLEAHRPSDAAGRATRDRFIAFVRAHPDCFDRSYAPGHVTAAGWLVHPEGDRVLLTHHRLLGRWLQPGGHCDGDPDVRRVALREAHEESGLPDVRLVGDAIFDLDIHPIPARGGTPGHLHYDVRFLLAAHGSAEFRVSDESHDLAWVGPAEAARFDLDESVRRMFRKWQPRRRGAGTPLVSP